MADIRKKQKEIPGFQTNVWVGQVPMNQETNITHPKGWGDRVAVRIVGVDSKDGTDTPDADLPMATILKPTSQGNLSRGSVGIVGGEWVIGMYINGPPTLDRVIIGVLGRSDPRFEITDTMSHQMRSTEFKTIKAHTAESNTPPAHQTKGSGSVPGDGKPKNAFPIPDTDEWGDYTKDYSADSAVWTA